MLKKCKEFADKRAPGSELYEKRGGFKWIDIYAGAIGEVGVYNILKELGIEVNKPDFAIYSKRNKNYNADLTDGNFHFHVKSQTIESASKYGNSWIMQKSDPILNKPQKTHFLVPCNVDTQHGIVTVLGCTKITDLVNHNAIGECKLEWFRKTKCAIYEEDIKNKLTFYKRWTILS